MSDINKKRLDRLSKDLNEHMAKSDYPTFGGDKKINQKIDKPSTPKVETPKKPQPTGDQLMAQLKAARQGISSPGITANKKKD